MRPNNDKKDQSIQLLRIIATLLVVLGHSEFLAISTRIPQMGIDWRDVIQSGSLIAHITNIITVLIYSFHMHLFIFISGWVFALCLKKGKYGNFKDLVSSKYKRLIIPYFAVTIIYNIPILGLSGYFSKTDANATFYNIFLYIIGYGKDHLWFLCTLFFIFIILYKLAILSISNKGINKMWIAIMTMTCLLMYALSRLPLFQNIELFYVDRVLQYSIWFTAGFVSFLLKDRILNLLKRFSLFFIIVTGIAWLTSTYLKDRTNQVIVSEFCRFFSAFFGIAVSLSVAFIINNHFPKLMDSKVMKLLGKHSLNIYLYGPPLNYVVIGTLLAVNKTISLNSLQAFGLYCVRILVQIIIPILIGSVIEKAKKTIAISVNS